MEKEQNWWFEFFFFTKPFSSCNNTILKIEQKYFPEFLLCINYYAHAKLKSKQKPDYI